MDEMCRFTLLALISVPKIYYFNLPSCVARYSGLNEWKQKPRI